MYTQTIENSPMKELPRFFSNVAISILSAILVIAGIILSVSLSVILFPFVALNLYLIKRRFNQMMQSQSSTYAQGDIIEGEYIVSEKTVSEEMARKPKEP